MATLRPRDRLLDVGANPRLMLTTMRELGFEAKGGDLHPESFECVISRFCLDVGAVDIEREPLPFAERVVRRSVIVGCSSLGKRRRPRPPARHYRRGCLAGWRLYCGCCEEAWCEEPLATEKVAAPPTSKLAARSRGHVEAGITSIPCGFNGWRWQQVAEVSRSTRSFRTGSRLISPISEGVSLRLGACRAFASYSYSV